MNRFTFALALALTLAGCDVGQQPALYHTESRAPSFTDDGVQSMAYMGAILADRGANFSVYSSRAERVEVLLFDDPEATLPTRRIPLERFGDVWNIYVEGIGVGQYYGYVAWGPNWPYDPEWYPGSIKGFIADVDAEGNRFDPNKLLSDPYSVALNRDHDWGKGSCASGPDRTVSTWAASAKSIIVQSEYQWSQNEAVWLAARKDPDRAGHRFTDVILYEVHPKGFTKSTASGVMHPGTFRGFGEKADYLADLGITAVELLPVMEKPLDGGYWGYNTINFFAPEYSFGSQQELAEVLDEFKWMVDQLHQRDIEVILDVVYNHTGEGGFWRSKIEQDPAGSQLATNPELVNFDAKEVASIYSFRGLDNAAYYVLKADKAYYWDDTGVGNQVRANNAPGRKLIMDSLHYWAEEMHVDGFRFDLAALLGSHDDDPTQWDAEATVLGDIVNDAWFQENNIRIIAEPWAMGQYHVGGFTVSQARPDYAWGEWNGNFRDAWRGFINYDARALNAKEGVIDIGGALTGSQDLYGWNARKPYHSVNFVTCHDGFTMYDLFSYDQKVNGCSPLNPVCCQNPTDPFCTKNTGEDNNRSRNWGMDQEDFKRQLMRNAFAAMMISHGMPMILGGDEWMRTQLGNNNAYSTSSDNPSNWYDWGAWQADPGKTRMHDFVRQLVAVRKQLGYAFAPGDYSEGAARFAWKDEGNGDNPNWGSRHIMQHYYNVGTNAEVVVLINMELGDVTFTLPGTGVWLRLVDTQGYFDSADYFTSTGKDAALTGNVELDAPTPVTGSYTAKTRSIVILKGTPR
ncbi:MAG TPA: alpha-amylase family glycosyl hydrolase [Polyangia bacterium]|jgi:glycogen operon protein